MEFVHETLALRVLFGAGRRAELTDELAQLGQRPMAIISESARRVAPELCDDITRVAAAVIDDVRQHVPIERAEAARTLAGQVEADCLLAIGGGSAIGLAKAVALKMGLAIIAIPTTYSGSEMTSVWGITQNNAKTTGRDPLVAPRVVIYDPQLTYSMPASLTAASGLNAVAHCVDSLWAPGRTLLSQATAERGIALLATGLPMAVDDPLAASGRDTALAGAWMAGVALGTAGASVHHKLCHLLGGKFDLPHAETHAVLLPIVAELAVRHLPEAADSMRRGLGSDDPVVGLRELCSNLRAPTTLRPFGFTPEKALEAAAQVDPATLAAPFPIERADVEAVLLAAADAITDQPEQRSKEFGE